MPVELEEELEVELELEFELELELLPLVVVAGLVTLFNELLIEPINNSKAA
jgi:hypothetical protein